MVRLRQLFGQVLHAQDGPIGKVEDVYFEDTDWHIRYLVVNTGNWLIGSRVLLPPRKVNVSDNGEYSIEVDLTQDQIEHSPSTSEHPPVSRQREQELATYYQWPYLWSSQMGEGVGAVLSVQHAKMSGVQHEVNAASATPRETHLRSIKEICGYHVLGRDHAVGYVEDLVADLGPWQIRCLVIEQRVILPSKRFLVFPGEIRNIDWASSVIATRTLAEDFVTYDPNMLAHRGA